MFKKLITVMLLSLFITSLSEAANTNSAIAELRKLAVPLERALNTVVESYIQLLDPDQVDALNQVMQSLQDLTSAPIKTAFIYGEYDGKDYCSLNESSYRANREIYIRRAVAQGIFNCLNANKENCTYEKTNILDEVSCHAKSFISHNEFHGEIRKSLAIVQEGLKRLNKITEMFSKDDRESFNRFYVRLNILLKKEGMKAMLPIFRGMHDSSQYCQFGYNSYEENRRNHLRLALQNAVNACNEAGYLNCAPVKRFETGSDIMVGDSDYKTGLVTNEINCTAYMWVQPVVE